MKKKTPPRKRILGKSRRFFFSFLAGAILISSLFTLSLAVTLDLSPSMDEALFRGVKEKAVTGLFYYDGENAVEWEKERITAGGACLYTPLEEMPEYLKNAFVAMEDHRFYRHSGVDVIRTAKAVLNRLLGEKKRFGGSTITQQLIKNIGGERDRTVARKYREILRAEMLEARHTKDEILEAYLNIVPMAEGCVGVGAAAEGYFGKAPSALTLAEAASLAAMTPAPARLNPRADLRAHTERRNLVLSRMAELGYITEEARDAAQSEALSVVKKQEKKEENRSWYAERVLSEVREGLLKMGYTESAVSALIYGGGLRIYTALDPRAQDALEAAFSENSFGEGFHAGGAVFSPDTGKLVALVGDLGEKRGNRLFSYVTDMRRSPGSALKPIALYAPALEEGIVTEASIFDDVPQSFEGGTAWPKNTPDAYDGLILAKDALIQSKNTVAVSLCRRLGWEHIYAWLTREFRIENLVRRSTDAKGNVRTDLADAPLALGELTNGVSLFEMTRAYLPIAREGKMGEGSSLYRVENAKGELLFLADEREERILSAVTASTLTHMLAGVVDEGSAKSLSLSETVDTAGKTGSSGGNRDRWFIGYTPYYLCGIWCGYEKGSTAVTGVPHLSLFDAVMKPLHATISDGEIKGFQMAEGLREVTVCSDSGKMQTVVCKEDARGERTTTVWVPSGMYLACCDTHVSVFYDDENDGVAYPSAKGREGALRRVSLISVPGRSFPTEVIVRDAEYVYRDPLGTDAPDGDLPFFANAIPKGVYIGKSHGGRPYNAAAHPFSVPPFLEGDEKEEKKESAPSRGNRPRDARKRRLPFLPFFGL